MSIAYQSRALGLAGAVFARQVAREETHVAITYRAREDSVATTLSTAYFGDTGQRRDGEAGLLSELPDATLCVLRSELVAPAIGALVVQGADRYRLEAFRSAPGGVEWILTLTKST